MKKLMITGGVLLASAGMFACERTQNNDTATEDNKVVVDRDSVATEYEVTETVVEYDTTQRTRTVDADRDTDAKLD